MYPPNWEVKSQRAGGVTFDLPSDLLRLSALFVKFEYSPFPIDLVATVDEGVLNAIVAEAAETFDDFKLLDKGIWKDHGYFVEFTSTPGYQVFGYGLLIDIPFESGCFRLMLNRVGGTITTITTITEEELDILDILISTLRLKEPMQAQTAVATSQPEPSVSPGTPTVTHTTTGMAHVKKSANLRQGPGTNYAVVGGAEAGDVLELLGRNEAGDWLYVEPATGPAWIVAFLVEHGDISDLPVEQSTAPTVTPAPQPTAVSRSVVQIGEEIEGGGWRFKVSETHKRKAVYFYGNSYVAHGHFLIVIIDAVNLQSGTDYLARNLKPWITDRSSNVYQRSSKGSSYARWQYGGLSSLFTDVNPGNFVRIALAFDLPDNLGDIRLSTDIPKWIDLGDFSAMLSEDV